MSNTFFQFKQFRIDQENAAMKVGVDSVILGSWLRLKNPESILDIGTGTGLLALMLAQRSVNSQIVAVEIDDDAIWDARRNFQTSKFAARLDLVHTSIQEFAMISDRKFDLIISNPPYFENGNRSENGSRSKARHQDELSIEDLFDCAAQLLSESGSFALILPFNLKETAKLLAETKGLFFNAALKIFPTPEKQPNRIVMQFGTVGQATEKEDLIVRRNGSYTLDYKNLTHDFYL